MGSPGQVRGQEGSKVEEGNEEGVVIDGCETQRKGPRRGSVWCGAETE